MGGYVFCKRLSLRYILFCMLRIKLFMISSEAAEIFLTLSLRCSSLSASSWLKLGRAGSGDNKKDFKGSANACRRLSLCFRLFSSRWARLLPLWGKGSISREFVASSISKIIAWHDQDDFAGWNCQNMTFMVQSHGAKTEKVGQGADEESVHWLRRNRKKDLKFTIDFVRWQAPPQSGKPPNAMN